MCIYIYVNIQLYKCTVIYMYMYMHGEWKAHEHEIWTKPDMVTWCCITCKYTCTYVHVHKTELTLTMKSWNDEVTSGTVFLVKLGGALSFTTSLLAITYVGTTSTFCSSRKDL